MSSSWRELSFNGCPTRETYVLKERYNDCLMLYSSYSGKDSNNKKYPLKHRFLIVQDDILCTNKYE